MIHFVVHGQPLPAPRPRVTRKGTYMGVEYEVWKETIAQVAAYEGVEKLSGSVRLGLIFLRQWHIRCDLDNLIKAAMDGLRGVLYEDDSQVKVVFAYVYGGSDKPRMEIVASEDDGDFKGDIELLEELWGERNP